MAVTVWVVQYTDTKELYGVFTTRDAALAHIERENEPCELRRTREITNFYKVEVHNVVDDDTTVVQLMLYETTVLG